MDFEPTMVYKASGPHQCLGGTFDYKGVSTQEEFDAAITAGWYATLDEAIAPKVAPAQKSDPAASQIPAKISEPEPEPEPDAPPTRAELEQKATELGIKFDGRTGDKKLGELIAAALKD